MLGAKAAEILELFNKQCIFNSNSAKVTVDSIVSTLSWDKLEILACVKFEYSKDYLECVISERGENFFKRIIDDIS